MLTVHCPNGYGFPVKVSEPGLGVRGFTVIARSVLEVKHMVDHYYGKGHCRKPKPKACPLCRKLAH